MFAYIHTNMHVHMYTHSCSYTCIWIYLYMYIHVCTCNYRCGCVNLHTHSNILACAQTCTHKKLYMCIQHANDCPFLLDTTDTHMPACMHYLTTTVHWGLTLGLSVSVTPSSSFLKSTRTDRQVLLTGSGQPEGLDITLGSESTTHRDLSEIRQICSLR